MVKKIKTKADLKPEAGLIKQLLKGNKRAELEFENRYKSRLFNFICQKAPSKEAKEILQETLISALKSLPRFKGKSKLFTWLCSIARHEICDYYRKKKIKSIVFSRLPFLQNLVSQALSPELALEEKELKEKIFQVFKNINEGYSQILRLKYRDGLSMKQIAKQLKTTVKAVESKLSRARKAFENEFKQQTIKTKKVEFNKLWSTYWDQDLRP